MSWGDGEPPTTDNISGGWIAVAEEVDGTWTIAHAYADDGDYEVVVTATTTTTRRGPRPPR